MPSLSGNYLKSFKTVKMFSFQSAIEHIYPLVHEFRKAKPPPAAVAAAAAVIEKVIPVKTVFQ